MTVPLLAIKNVYQTNHTTLVAIMTLIHAWSGVQHQIVLLVRLVQMVFAAVLRIATESSAEIMAAVEVAEHARVV
jgi:energy-coupling factor transporter transmembrane protein EcfT